MRSVERVSVIDQVVEQLRSAITGGEYNVGEKLPTEVELCSRLGVGRSTVREALRVLQAVGLVELRPGRGAFVASTHEDTPESIARWFAQKRPVLRDIMELREAIEPVAVKLAAARHRTNDLKRLDSVNRRFVEAARVHNVPELALLDEEFHNTIVDAADNSLLTRVNRLIAKELKDYRVRAFAVPDNVAHAIRPHQQILEAIARRDADAAVAQMTEHLEISMADIVQEAERVDRRDREEAARVSRER